ncbi:EamA-like transporter family protein [Microterricola gilva]|uniref:EamA-like transporter family protein n=1 Tax=Microterricola gilva TaxID=393267 RepID=A0A4Q8AKC3_9MICO|nr:EamA family transporter [Microterricola gilva]RZU64957.1 EamA-like transporter family protein [Microterricola gilva]
MSLFAFTLVVVAAIAHAAWNLASKKASSSGLLFIWLGAVASTVFYLPLAIVDIGLHGLELRSFILGATVSAVLHVAYMFLLQRGYAAGDISVVYPMARGTGPLLTVVFAIVIFGERPPPLALFGALVIVAGVVAIGLAGSVGRRRAASAGLGMPGAAPSRMRAGIIYGLLTGVSIAAYTLWDASVVNGGGVSPLTFMVGCTLGELVLLAPIALRRRAQLVTVWRSFKREAVIVGLLSPLSYILVLWAMQLAPVSLVAPARELSVVLVSLAGWLVYREPNPVQRMVGAVVVLGGVALLAVA